MNAFRRHAELDLPVEGPPGDDGGRGDLPPVEVRTGGGGGRGPSVPRRGYRQYLPFIFLGAAMIATERLTLITLQTRDLPHTAYVIAAAILILAVGAGVFVGGFFFYRAYHADRA